MTDCYELIDKGLKRCYSCGNTKSLENFCKDKLGIGGLKNQCRDCQRIQRAKYWEKNKEKEKGANRAYKSIHSVELYEKRKKYVVKNPEKLKIWKRAHYLKCREIPQKRLEMVMSGAIKKRVEYHRAMGKFKDILGYSTEELVAHLESKFTPEMSWENHGTYWHIDHIKPKSWFKYETVQDDEFKKCWALSNLQPLKASINTSKQARYEG